MLVDHSKSRGLTRLAQATAGLQGWCRTLASLAAGAIAVLGQAPYDLAIACFISFPFLVWLLEGTATKRRPRRASFLVGWWFGLGYFVSGLWWIGNALLVEADSFAWAIPFAVLALPAFLALFYGTATFVAGFYSGPTIGRVAALAVAFALAEWLRSFLFTGFPWNAIGYAAMPSPLLMQPVAAVGMDAMNLLAVFVFAAPALFAYRRHRKKGLAIATLIAAMGVSYGAWRLALPELATPPVDVRIVQPSVDQAEKWNREIRDRIFQRHLELSAGPAASGAGPDLILWPETSVPFLFSDRPDALAAIGELLAGGQTLLAGAVRDLPDPAAPGGRRFYNSIISIGDDGRIRSAADKVHLVPFGEYLPLADLLQKLGIRQLATVPGAFSAGEERRPIEAGGVKLLALICYEIIFANEVSRTAAGAQLIVNVTNDAWYGNTPGPHQHLRQAQVRAVETGLAVARAANNGISAAIDSRGRVLSSLALDEVGRVDASLVPGPFPVQPNREIIFAALLLLFSAMAGLMHSASRIQSN